MYNEETGKWSGNQLSLGIEYLESPIFDVDQTFDGEIALAC